MSYENYGINNIQNSITYSVNSDSFYVYTRHEIFQITAEVLLYHDIIRADIERLFLLCLLLKRWNESIDFQDTFMLLLTS